MKDVISAAALVLSLLAPVAPVSAQTGEAANLGSVTLSHKVSADGQTLAAGTYQVRLSADAVKPVVGQSPDGAKYVEFVKGGKVVARELATVVADADVPSVMKGARVEKGGTRVEMLKGNDYLRVWINRGGSNYIVHLPVGA